MRTRVGKKTRRRRWRVCAPVFSEASNCLVPETDTRVSDAKALFQAAVRRVQSDRLLDATDPATWGPESLRTYDTVRVAGLGKAAMALAGTVEDQHPGLVDGGTVVVPDGYPDTLPDHLPRPSRVDVQTGGHPLPTDDSVRAARRLMETAEALGEGDLLLTLVSGGGTALTTWPAGSLEVADLRATYQRLMNAGVPIGPTNAVRKHLTQVGGGQLARAAHPAEVGALVVSDVVGDDLATIASGPTVPDPSTYEEAMRVLYQHDLWTEVPAPVRAHLSDGARDQHPETPTADAPCFERARTQLIGTNETALEAARAAAKDLGYVVRDVTGGVTGEARVLGHRHAKTIRDAEPEEPTCWLWGGEPTVTVTGDGAGGRNQEAALAAALALEAAPTEAVFLSGGTDGIDGPTDAAGGWATPATAEAVAAAGFDLKERLRDNDSYPVLDAVDHLLQPGPTHTNVMDVHIGLVRPTS